MRSPCSAVSFLASLSFTIFGFVDDLPSEGENPRGSHFSRIVYGRSACNYLVLRLWLPCFLRVSGAFKTTAVADRLWRGGHGLSVSHVDTLEFASSASRGRAQIAKRTSTCRATSSLPFRISIISGCQSVTGLLNSNVGVFHSRQPSRSMWRREQRQSEFEHA